MTCPHCGFLMSPLDVDCARCRHRGYVPPIPPASPPLNAPHPTPFYSPIPPAAPQSPPASRALEVIACLMSMTALFGLVLFGLILHQRRNARQQAEIAALRQQLAEAQQSQTYTQFQTPPQPQVIRVEVQSPAYPVYVPAMPAYPPLDPFASPIQRRHEIMNQQLEMMRQHQEDMQRLHQSNVERMNANMQRMQNRMQDMRERMQSARPHADPHDPFNPFGRF